MPFSTFHRSVGACSIFYPGELYQGARTDCVCALLHLRSNSILFVIDFIFGSISLRPMLRGYDGTYVRMRYRQFNLVALQHVRIVFDARCQEMI